MALHVKYRTVSSLSDRTGELKNASDTNSLHILLDVFSMSEIQTKITENKSCDIWDMAKKFQFVSSDMASLRSIFNCCEKNLSYGNKYTNSTPMVSLFQDLMGYISPKIQKQINSYKQFSKQLEMLRKEFTMNSGYNTDIILSKSNVLSKEDRVVKLLDIFKDAELTSQVNREHLYSNKNILLWNYAKFNYSNEVKRGLVLNDDVISVIKSFIPNDTRMGHLRLRYTDMWFTNELMKKTKKQLRNIVNHINDGPQIFLTHSYWSNAITLSGTKGEQVSKIVAQFSKIEHMSKGGSYIRELGKEYLQEYKKRVFKFFLLLVSIAKNPAKNKVVRI